MVSKPLETKKIDIGIALTKGTLGAIPFAGTALGEILSLSIPNQRLDRVASFVAELEKRISEVEQLKLKDNQYFIDLLEDGILQATKALSEERNGYIAIFLSKNKEINSDDFSVKKKLLQTLEGLTDTDLDILRLLHNNSYSEAYHRYSAQQQTIGFVDSLNPEELYEYELAQAAWDAHINSLERNKLIFAVHKMPPDDPDVEQQYLDESTGLAEVTGHEVTALGKVLLKSIEE